MQFPEGLENTPFTDMNTYVSEFDDFVTNDNKIQDF